MTHFSSGIDYTPIINSINYFAFIIILLIVLHDKRDWSTDDTQVQREIISSDETYHWGSYGLWYCADWYLSLW